MAIIATEDFEGAPTSGALVFANHDVIADPTGVPYGDAQISYAAAGYTPGFGGIAINGANWAWLPVLLEGRDRIRFRFYIKKSGTQSGHNFLVYPSATADANVAPTAVGSGYDLQIRNTTGGPIWNRYNFTNAGASGAWAADTWWRVEYEFVNDAHASLPAGAKVEIWTDPDSTGEPDFTSTAAGAGDAGKLVFGNTSVASGLTTTWAHLATSDGERIGPFVASSADPATFNVVINEDDATLTWSAPAMAGATHVDIFRRPASGTGDVTAFDPNVSTPVARVPIAQLTYADPDLANGFYAWQVFPVIEV